LIREKKEGSGSSRNSTPERKKWPGEKQKRHWARAIRGKEEIIFNEREKPKIAGKPPVIKKSQSMLGEDRSLKKHNQLSVE